MAERQGFEPWVRKRTTVFETAPFDHSGISPHVWQGFGPRRGARNVANQPRLGKASIGEKPGNAAACGKTLKKAPKTRVSAIDNAPGPSILPPFQARPWARCPLAPSICGI